MAFGFFEPSKGETRTSIKRQRAIAAILAQRVAGPTPKNIGEGIGLLGTSAAGAFINYKADRSERAGRDKFAPINQLALDDPTVANISAALGHEFASPGQQIVLKEMLGPLIDANAPLTKQQLIGNTFREGQEERRASQFAQTLAQGNRSIGVAAGSRSDTADAREAAIAARLLRDETSATALVAAREDRQDHSREQQRLRIEAGVNIPVDPNFFAGDGTGPDLTAVAKEDTLFEQAGDATGLYSLIVSVAAGIGGQIPGKVGDALVNKKVVKARKDFDISSQTMLQAFVVNPKFNVAEVERIKTEIGAVTGVTTSGRMLKIQLRSLDRFMARKIATQLRNANDPKIPADERAAAATNARLMQEYRKIIGIPQDDGNPQPAPEIFDLQNEQPFDDEIEQILRLYDG